MKTYKQLTYALRCQIFALNKTGKRGYRFKQAQTLSEKRRLSSSKSIKMNVEIISCIESKIKEEWSPDQISGWLREEQNILISHETIYQHIGKRWISGQGKLRRIYH